ncbi:amidase family protein [Mycoplasmopsis opalescens]|uniref:amidase family protein n=1 Tax=Mycoplasmopsis opalescens TaxID=114886 RepID=UPI0004A737C8|nr:amidase family protein [Mycoplasmopsis opalescens]
MKLEVQGNFNQAIQELKNDQNNCVAYVFEDLNQNNGIIKNATFTIKDVFATEDAPTTASSKLLKNFKPSYNATCVQKLIDNGAQKVAKVYCDELALGGTGTYSAFGLIRNPLDPNRLSGGSSSGSVATFTKNISLALASDTGDSVRLPASYLGVVGYKPSYGAISRYGMFAYASSLDTVSYFTHNVNDAIIYASVLFGKDKNDFTSKSLKVKSNQSIKPKKINLLKINEKYLSTDVLEAYKTLKKQLSDAGITINEVDVDEQILLAVKPIYEIISFSEASSNLANLNGIAFGNRKEGDSWEKIMTNTRSQGFHLMVQRRLTLGSFFLHSENQKELFIKAQQGRRLVKEYWDNLTKTADLLVFPASADVAPFIDNNKNKNDYSFMEWILTTSNLAGNPSITLPWIKSKKEKLPINLALDGEIDHDQKLLSHAKWIEEFLGGNYE